jgi:hypothetical protein
MGQSPAVTEVFQLIYHSQPFGFDEGILNGILVSARRNNVRDDITGALICRADVYLQLLEGPRQAVEATFGRIRRDDRHLEVQRCLAMPAAARLFPAWAMRDDPARSWMWTADEVHGGAIARASEASLRAVFARVAAESPTSNVSSAL